MGIIEWKSFIRSLWTKTQFRYLLKMRWDHIFVDKQFIKKINFNLKIVTSFKKIVKEECIINSLKKYNVLGSIWIVVFLLISFANFLFYTHYKIIIITILKLL